MAAAGLLFAVMLTVLLTNFGERNESAKINNAISSIYKDRFIVESYIFQYSTNLQKIVEIIDNDDNNPIAAKPQIDAILANIEHLHDAYKKTEFTDKEAQHFTKLVNICQQIHMGYQTEQFHQVKNSIKEATLTLNALSAIQISEAQAQMSTISQLFSATSVYSQFEIVVLIIIGLLIQALIFASKTLTAKQLPQQSQLN